MSSSAASLMRAFLLVACWLVAARAMLMMIVRKPRTVGAAGARPRGSVPEVRVCTHGPCKSKGSEDLVALMADAALAAADGFDAPVNVVSSGCLGPCGFGVNVVAGWGSGGGGKGGASRKITRANVCRAERPAKVPEGVYHEAAGREDCDAILAGLAAAGGLGGAAGGAS